MKQSEERIHRKLDDPNLLADVEQNFREEMLYLARTQPDGEIRSDSELTTFFTDTDGPSGVLVTHFADISARHIQQRIEEIVAYFRERGVDEFWWQVEPTASPSNMADYLQMRGFTPRDTAQCMILQAEHANNEQPLSSLVVSEVTNEAELRIKCDLEARGFSSSVGDAKRYFESYLRRGFGTGMPWHHYIGWLNNQPVGVAAIMLHSGVAGIYGVATPPEYRRQGIGAALTMHSIHAAQELGYPIVTLSNTAMSAALYKRLGFQDYCQLRNYGIVLTPDEADDH